MNFPFPLLADAAPQQTWTLGHEGLAPSWAFLFFLLLSVATVVAYLRCAPEIGRIKRATLITLRLLAAALLAFLLTKPTLRFTDYQAVKQPLAILVDSSLSMAIPEQRDTPADINRAAIAAGLIDPTADITQPLPTADAEKIRTLSREDLINRLGHNSKLDLWNHLARQADLFFYQFGSAANPTGTATVNLDRNGKPDSSVEFPTLTSDQKSTAIGESLRQVLQEPRGQALGGVVLITDGQSNTGSSPIEAAQIAKEQHVPLYIYGIGLTTPPDIQITSVTAQPLAFVGERMEVHAHIVSHNIEDIATTIALRADGRNVDQIELPIGGDREQDITLHLTPNAAGEVKLEVTTPVRPEEAGKDNNTASTTVRITDRKFRVLLIEREPRWDFRYLLDYLQRDPRLEVNCVMIDGEPGLDRLPDSPFLMSIPDTHEEIFKYQVLILGDVNPADLGYDRMQIIQEWTEAGGGIIFLAGAGYNPAAYGNTPLEPLLPIASEVSSLGTAATLREAQPFPLDLTPLGRSSPYLQMDPDPVVNQKIWEAFPGIRWAAPVTRIKPGAEILLVDPRPASTTRYGALPVFAMQGYGSGKSVYFGTDETYRWRSKTGEKYYSILWGQIMQTLALQLLDGASSTTQLKTDRKQYNLGDRVIIAGNVYAQDYSPLIVPTLEGEIQITGPGNSPPTTQALNLTAIQKNTFRGEIIAETPGTYTFHTTRDPEGILKFEVTDSNLEKTQTALDSRLLTAMATAADGKFLREEDLHNLPGWITSTTSHIAIYRKKELYYSAWILSALLLLLFAEWLIRRLSRLK